MNIEKLTASGQQFEVKTSLQIKKEVQNARDIQTKRFKETRIICNAEMNTKEVKQFCSLSTECLNFLRQAVLRFQFSARSYYRIIKVSRTIADLEEEKEILVSHVAEALQYRPKEID